MHVKISALILAVGLTLTSTSSSHAGDAFGTVEGSYNGQSIYSNGTVGNNSGSYNTVNGTKTGLKWQCVEFVSRYYLVVYGKNLQPAGNASSFYAYGPKVSLTQYANGGTMPPRVGDVLCSASNTYGHVAIVREVGTNYIKVAQQNWSNTASDVAYQIPMTVSINKTYTVQTVSGYSWQGWLHKP